MISKSLFFSFLKMYFPLTAFVFFLYTINSFAQTTVFINEIHYDNASTDEGETIEVAGPAGTDLTGWSLVLYNGANGLQYDSDSFTGTIPDLGGGYGVMVMTYPVNGIQNGSPDAIALVDASNNLIQFLSYEGNVTALDGPANGLTSTDILVSETSSTPVGFSLQLSGGGTDYEDFTWNAPAQNTFGSFNTNQTFGGGGDSAPFIVSTLPTDNATDIQVDANIEINFSEDVSVNGTWFSITGSASGSITAVTTGGPTNFALDPNTDFAAGETITVTVFASQISDLDANDPPDNMNVDYIFTFTTALAQSGWVINEILADPATDISGDANGDGVRDSADDEFIEIYNNTGNAVDISGWTVSDAVGVRHTFPLGSVIPDQCPVVIFGGGTPTGTFGGAVIQTASSGSIGLNNGGDDITLNDGTNNIAIYSYGSEGGNDQSLTRDPDITGTFALHSNATGSNGTLFSPGTMVDGSLFPGCSLEPVVKEIYEIQGSGLSSPFANQTVTTDSNVVTAVGTDGFFIQTPSERIDVDENTSNGIFVYTNNAPSVSVGDLVDVTGQVIEYFGFTEITNPTITVTGTGTVPASIIFDEFLPSPNQPQSEVEFERLEGMLISITGGTVTASNQRFSSDINAEVYITAAPVRTYREPGIEYPGLGGSIPTWDGNPEVFELDPDKLGLPNLIIPAGSSFNATGVLGYEFGGYELWATSLSVTNENIIPQPVRSREPGEATVASLNLYRLFDAVADGGETVVTQTEYERRLTKFSMYIRNVLNSPDILAVEEVEKLGVLQDLADKIQSDDALISYSAFLEEGNDIGGIDVGFLVRNDKAQVDSVIQFAKDDTFIDPTDGSVDILHDRPPLLLYGSFIVNGGNNFPITVMAVHNRSLSGIEDSNDGPRVRQKRLEQAQSIAGKIQELQTVNPEINLVVTGDFNAYEFTDGYVDVVGQIKGSFNPAENLLSGDDLVEPDLTNQVLNIPIDERYSFIFNGTAQVLDHALTSVSLNEAVTGFTYGRGNSDAAENYIYSSATPLRSSDHDGLVLFIDVTPPEITLAEPAVLWPPFHQYVTFNVSDFVTSVTDNGSQIDIANVYITSVTSDEPKNIFGFRDGITKNDIIIVDCQTVKVRAERNWFKNGRVYTINVAVEDSHGSTGTAAYKINVPFIPKKPVVDDGPAYEVFSECSAPGNTEQLLVKSNNLNNETENDALPTEYSLEQNYPNPFNPETTIRFALPEAGYVEIKIYNALGEEIITLTKREFAAGIHNVIWNSRDKNGHQVSSGLYIYRITAGGFINTKKMMLLR